LVEALKDKGVKPGDIMSNVRRFERNGFVYVRGYRMHDKQTPFKDGYLLTWIGLGRPREQSIEEAIKKTNAVLDSKASTSPIIERIHLIRDQILEATKLRDLVNFEFIQNKLSCSPYEAEGAIARALQLYPDLKMVKLFNAYNYYYHTSLAEEDLKVAIAFKQNYVRSMKGRQNRIGHNWEACVEWFIDKYTTGAVFQTQNHRTSVMDPRRITLHLMKSVGGRRQNAEVDRVWSVTPSIFAQPITYVLECKWGLVRKHEVDDFLEVLRARAIRENYIAVGWNLVRDLTHVHEEDMESICREDLTGWEDENILDAIKTLKQFRYEMMEDDIVVVSDPESIYGVGKINARATTKGKNLVACRVIFQSLVFTHFIIEEMWNG
jgi:hypothetical protein